jgi:hypothetical protein
MPANKKIFFLLFVSCILFFLFFLDSNCSVRYGFKDVSIPDSIKTVKIITLENRARYNNPQLNQRLTERLRQKIISQTRLSQTNSDNADWEISGYISDYSVSTSGISQQQVATNRLNVSVHITLFKRKENDQKDYDVTHSFDFSASLTLQAAEASLFDQIIRDMTDDIFNRIFSNW